MKQPFEVPKTRRRQPQPPVLTMKLSLRWKILLLAVLTPLTLGLATFVTVHRNVNEHVNSSSIHESLAHSASVFESMLETRSRALAGGGQVIAQDPRFFSLLMLGVAQRDYRFVATVKGMATDFNRITQTDLFEVVDRHGKLLASVGPAESDHIGRNAMVREALRGKPVQGVLAENGSHYQVALTPVTADGRDRGRADPRRPHRRVAREPAALADALRGDVPVGRHDHGHHALGARRSHRADQEGQLVEDRTRRRPRTLRRAPGHGRTCDLSHAGPAHPRVRCRDTAALRDATLVRSRDLVPSPDAEGHVPARGARGRDRAPVGLGVQRTGPAPAPEPGARRPRDGEGELRSPARGAARRRTGVPVGALRRDAPARAGVRQQSRAIRAAQERVHRDRLARAAHADQRARGLSRRDRRRQPRPGDAEAAGGARGDARPSVAAHTRGRGRDARRAGTRRAPRAQFGAAGHRTDRAARGGLGARRGREPHGEGRCVVQAAGRAGDGGRQEPRAGDHPSGLECDSLHARQRAGGRGRVRARRPCAHRGARQRRRHRGGSPPGPARRRLDGRDAPAAGCRRRRHQVRPGSGSGCRSRVRSPKRTAEHSPPRAASARAACSRSSSRSRATKSSAPPP